LESVGDFDSFVWEGAPGRQTDGPSEKNQCEFRECPLKGKLGKRLGIKSRDSRRGRAGKFLFRMSIARGRKDEVG